MKILIWGLVTSMKDKNQQPKETKIIKINQILQKNNKKMPFFMQNSENDKQEDEDYIILSETQKFKYTLNYVIKLLKAKKITVDDALNLLMDLI